MLVYITLPSQTYLVTSHSSFSLVIPMALGNLLNVVEVAL